MDAGKDCLTVHIITLSDRAYAGLYKDRSGPVILELLADYSAGEGKSFQTSYTLLPDDPVQLEKHVLDLAAAQVDIIITTGGTGVGERDSVPDTLRPLFDKEVSGIMEYIRVTSGANNPNALISRSTAGIIGKSQVYALPGSVKAVREYMTIILKVVEHMYDMLHGIDSHA